MRSTIHVVPEAQFKAWIKSQMASGSSSIHGRRDYGIMLRDAMTGSEGTL